MSQSTKQGFTLLELLFVIAIIALFTTLALPALMNARNKSYDSAITSDLRQVQTQAQLLLTTNGCYANESGCRFSAIGPELCTAISNSMFDQASILQLVTDATSAGGGLSSCAVAENGTSWAVIVPLRTDNTRAWCVDSAGKAEEVANNGSGDFPYNQDDLDDAIFSALCQ
jgi:prepilin-type N-terminal cleavage/methylation domain-containing protein